MFSIQNMNKGFREQMIHKQCIVKVYKGKKIENNNIYVNPIKSFHK